MPWQMTPFTIPLILVTGISLGVTILTWVRSSQPGGKIMAWLMVMATLWCAGYLFESSSPGLKEALFWAKFQYSAFTILPVLWLFGAFELTQMHLGRARHHTLLLFLEPILMVGLIWTTETNGLVWSQISQLPKNGMVYLQLTYGLFFWVHVVFSYTLLVAGSLICLRHHLYSHAISRQHTLIVLIGTALPWAGKLISQTDLLSSTNLELTPLGYILLGGVISMAVLRYQFMDYGSVSRASLLDHLDEAILLLDWRGRIIDLNRSAGWLLNLDPQQTLGKPASQALSSWPFDLISAETLEEMHSTITLPELGSERTFEIQIKPIFGEKDRLRGKVILLREITCSKQKTQELGVTREAAETENQAKNHFLANISHELRTPLAIMMSYAEILMDKAIQENQPDWLLKTQRIHQSGERLLRIMNDILNTVAFEINPVTVTPEVIDLSELLREIVYRYRKSCQEYGNQILLGDVDDLAPVYLDREKTSRVLDHLIDNANKFTRQGIIKISAQVEMRTGIKWLRLDVRDNGIGIQPEYLSRMFEAFTQADTSPTRQYGGAGLGLGLCSRLCQAMGGSIHACSQPGRGSVFTVRIPYQSVPLQIDRVVHPEEIVLV